MIWVADLVLYDMIALHATKFIGFRKLIRSPRCFLGLQALFLDNKSIIAVNHSTKWFLKREAYSTSTEKSENKTKRTDNFKPENSIKGKTGDIVEQENIWTIPNILCCTRIAFSPYLSFLIFDGRFNLAFYLMIFVGLTDLLDGYIARTFTSQSSKFGTFLDPLADKILIATACITLTCVKLIPVELTTLILARDLALAGAGFYIRYKTLPPPRTLARYFDATHATAKLEPTLISKFNTIVQLAAIGTGLLSPILGFTDHPGLIYLWCFTASTTIASAISYIYEKDKYA